MGSGERSSSRQSKFPLDVFVCVCACVRRGIIGGQRERSYWSVLIDKADTEGGEAEVNTM